MNRSYTYDAFISYGSSDIDWVREFANCLKDLGLQACYDRGEFRLGHNFINEIHDNIPKSRKLVLIITPESAESEWVQAELSAKLLDDPNGKRGTIIPVLFRNSTENHIPKSIRHLHFADLRDHSQREAEWENILKSLGAKAQVFPKMPDPEISGSRQNRATPVLNPALFPISVSESPRNIAIIGMGYVGMSLAALLANAGHNVIGVEEKELKVDRINKGESHLLEPGIEELLQKAHLSERLSAIRKFDEAFPVDFAVVCLGPNKSSDGGKEVWDTSKLKNVLEEIGESIRHRRSDTPLNIIIAATVRPQDCEQKVLEGYLKRSHGDGFWISTSPLFCREGSMLTDLQNPPFIITGTFDGKHNSASREWSKILHNLVDSAKKDNCQLHCMTMGMAAMVKLASNTFHAMKVCFANEVGRICHEHGLDSQEVMNVFKQDHTLNISDYYLRPGFAFGGTCLGKDTYGLLSTAKNYSKNTFPLIGSIQESNNKHIAQAVKIIQYLIKKTKQDRIGIFGLTFKPGTDDLRSSPAMELIFRLPKIYTILAIDSDLKETPAITGKNREQLTKTLETHKILIVDNVEDIVSQCHILVIAKSKEVKVEDLKLTNQHCIVDLTGEVSSSAARDFPCIYRLV